MAAAGTEAVALTHPAATAHALPHDFGPSTLSISAPPLPATAGRGSRSSVPPPGLPAQVTIPSLHVSAPIAPVSISKTDALDVPQNPRVIGWWQASALPGSTVGTTVLDGHVDTARDGPGALFHLQDLPAASLIIVRSTDGQPHRYRVTTRRVLHKSQGLPTGLFSPTAPGTLVIITCGGPFDRATHHYLDNIIILAQPLQLPAKH